MKINEVWGRKPKETPKASWVDIAKDLPPSKKSTSFLQQFEIVDTDPVTVQWKNQHFQRKDGTGEWVNFPAGKPVSQQMIDALDRISPPPESTQGRFTYPWQKDVQYQVNPQGSKE